MLLSLRSAAALVPEYVNPYALDPEIVEFNEALLAPYGMRFSEQLARQGRNVGFGALAEQLLSAAPGQPAEPDMIIVAYALPDPRSLGKTVSSHLNHLLGGRSRSFAVSEQGLAAPFTALRIARAYAQSGRCASLALFVLEQTTLPYPEPFVQDGGLIDSAVMLMFGPDSGWQVSSLHSAGPGASLAGLVGPLIRPESRDELLLVCGPWTDPGQLSGLGVASHRAAPGTYCTSVWLELARHHHSWGEQHQAILLCDTDPRIGISQVAVLTNREAAKRPGGAHAISGNA